ncbi:hypothetical protein HPB48_002517 [Haemaphysalis longicornis]|uniref:Uncharacterized protein n=1 Tax=Haemaphysalis longicornis TaxID=44386 RepID=A0A9J6G7P5_HAELO|nr:hypothetical protein HPB48_002517 [Haemaphysalis longicornis]
MIRSLVAQYDEFESLLESRDNTLMESVGSATFKDVVDFLELFREASDKLEQEKLSTLPLVLLYYRRLKGHHQWSQNSRKGQHSFGEASCKFKSCTR